MEQDTVMYVSGQHIVYDQKIMHALENQCQALQEARLVQNAFQVIYLLLGVFVLRTAFNNSEKRFSVNLTVKHIILSKKKTVKHIIKTWQLQKKKKKVLFDVVKFW